MRAAFVLASALVAISAGFACTSFSEEAPPADAGSEETKGLPDAGPPRSCAEILVRQPNTATRDGLYPIAGDGGAVQVYCDMTVEDGGWTLVGRSASNGSSTDFGWNKKTGQIGQLDYPYSLNVLAMQIPFSEVLVAERSPAGGVGDVAFRYEAKPGFFAAVDKTIEIRPVVYVRGPCNPEGGPSMMRHAGALSLNNAFFLRDIPDTNIRNGLQADGWNLTNGDCARNATLDGKQGVVLVR